MIFILLLRLWEIIVDSPLSVYLNRRYPKWRINLRKFEIYHLVRDELKIDVLMIHHDGKIERGYDTPIFIALNTDDGRKHHTIATKMVTLAYSLVFAFLQSRTTRWNAEFPFRDVTHVLRDCLRWSAPCSFGDVSRVFRDCRWHYIWNWTNVEFYCHGL